MFIAWPDGPGSYSATYLTYFEKNHTKREGGFYKGNTALKVMYYSSEKYTTKTVLTLT